MGKYNKNSLSIDKRLFQGGQNKLAILSELKDNSLSGFKKEVKKARRHPITNALILGKSKPKSYKELRESRPSFFSGNLEGEIAWLLESISLSKSELNAYIQLELQLEKEILFAKFENAQRLLDQIENEICFSYWGLELRYFLIEEMSGTEENWKYNGMVNSEVKNSYTLFFNQILSKRAEKGVSASDYQRSFSNEIRMASPHDFEYLSYKLSYHSIPDYNNYAFSIYADSSSSIIDRYISLLNILTELVSSKKEEYVHLAINVLEEIADINDVRLNRIREFCGTKVIDVDSENYIQVLENYTLGKYELCISEIPKILATSPGLVELWDIYVKSLIESKESFVETKVSTFLDVIIHKLYVTYSIVDESYQEAEELLKLVIMIPDLSFTKQLLALISSTLGLYSNKEIFINNFCIHSNYSNPLTLLQSDKCKTSQEYSGLLTSSCIKFMAGKIVDQQVLEKNISKFKFDLYQLRRSFRQKDFEECIKVGERFNLDKIRNNIFIEEIIFMMFHAYGNNGQLDKAIELYVSSYFENKNFIRRINASRMIEEIVKRNYPLEPSIDGAIFFNLNNLDSYHCFVTLEMWLESNGVQKPSDVQLPSGEINMMKHLFLLEHGCNVDVLEKFYFEYETKEDVVEERKKVLSVLIQNNSDEDSNRFIDELSTITHKEKVQSILQEVNSGRIHMTNNMLESIDEANIQNSYKRYKLLTDFSENVDLESYDSQTLLRNYLESFVDSKSVASNPSFLSFKSLVNEIIDGFLFNKKNGLDGELSTRIRHGELENQIRSAFDRKHLISKKDDSGEYADLTHWTEQYQEMLDENEMERLQLSLKRFSGEVDSMIQYFVDENIQVLSANYPDKRHGLFNYRFNDSYLNLLFEESRLNHDSFEEFLDYLFSILKAHTESNLNTVRDYLKDDFRRAVDEKLDGLRDSVFAISNDLIELNQSIIGAKNEFQNEILDISNWFVVADSSIERTMDIKTIIECSFESSNLKHPHTIIRPKINVDEKLFIQDYKHYIFILINLIENIRIYSKLPNEELEVEVKSVFENDHLIFSVKNNFDRDQLIVSDLETTFGRIKENWKNDVDPSSVNRERGSGYEKIKRILAYDVKTPEHSFDYKIENDTLEVIFSVGITFNYEIDA